MEEIIELIKKEGYKYSYNEQCEDDVDLHVYVRGNDYINLGISMIDNTVIDIFIPSIYINYPDNNYKYDVPGIYLGEGGLPVTVENLRKVFWIQNNPIEHEIELTKKYLKHLKWISEELYPVFQHFGIRFTGGIILNSYKEFTISFQDINDIIDEFKINPISGDLEGLLFDKYDIYGKLQFEIYCALENEFGN